MTMIPQPGQLAAERAKVGYRPPAIGDLSGVQPGSMLDPLGNVRGDIAAEYQRGAQTSIASGLGLAAREAVVSPVSRALGVASSIVKPITSAVGDFAKSAVTGDVAAPATPAVAQPPVTQTLAGGGDFTSTMSPDEQTRSVAAVAAQDPSQQASAAAAPVVGGVAPAAAVGVPRRVSISYLPEEPTPSLARDPAPDPTTSIMGMLNDGTWSGMQNAHLLAKRTDADRASQVAQANAQAALMHAASSRISADATAQNATTQAARTASENQRDAAIATGAGFDNANKKALSDLTTKYQSETDPEKRRQLGDQLLVMHGKDPRENAFKIAQYEDAIDPSNPLAGTRKIPMAIDAMGHVTPITPPAAQKATTSAPQEAIDYLKKNPGAAKDFDAKYGAGASRQALGK